MTDITINTYDPAGRFDLDEDGASKFFSYVAAEAEKAGFDVDYDEAISVDEESEQFVTDCFNNWDGE